MRWFYLPGSVAGDQSNANTAADGQMQMTATSQEFSQQCALQPLDMQTNTSDEDGTTTVLSATCTRTRTVKTPKQYDM